MKDEREVAATPEGGNLPALPDETTIQEVFEANFGDSGMMPSFETITKESASATMWTVPDDTLEGSKEKELHGVIIEHYLCRVYWKEAFGGENNLPDCTSHDNITGTKYGACATCQFSQWGSGKDAKGEPNRGQACQLRTRVYILLKGNYSIFPYLISLSPTSSPDPRGKGGYAGSLPTYAGRLFGQMSKLHNVLTKVVLIKNPKAGKYPHSRTHFFFESNLTEQEKKAANLIREKLLVAMRQKPFEGEEVLHPDEGEANGHEDATPPPRNPWDEEK